MVSPNAANTSQILEDSPTFGDVQCAGRDVPISVPLIIVKDSLMRVSSLDSLSNGKGTPPMSLPLKGEASEEQSEDEDYFEEFLLPNTGENAFVRHQSFRRKVQSTDIDAPDAERIEGLVRTGDFQRHGSIRKKILPDEDLQEIDEEFDPDNCDLSLSKEIDDLINSANVSMFENNDEQGRLISHPNNASTPFPNKRLPANTIESPNSSCIRRSPEEGKPDLTNDISEFFSDESLPIEQCTMLKIKYCLDYSSYNDIYSLSGRLQDILSPKEVEEVLNHSDKYSKLINSEILEVLSMSLHSQSKTSDRTNDTANTDSGFSSPKPPPEIKITDQDAVAAEVQPPEERDAVVEMEVEISITQVSDDQPSVLKKKISAPKIDLDSSTDLDLDSFCAEAEESITESSSFNKLEEEDSQDNDPFTPEFIEKKKITVDQIGISSLVDSSTSTGSVPLSVDSTYFEEPSTIEVASEVFPSDEDVSYSCPSLPPPPPDLIPELTAAEEIADERHWKNVVIGGSWRRIDMKAISLYKKCITHGGYTEGEKFPIIVLSAALLPEKTRKDYSYVMSNLFMYVLSILEHIVPDDYILIYLAGGLKRESEPGFHWMRKAYQMIDRRLRKNLKELLIVHPTIWARMIIALSRPFISSKFNRKLKFIRNLTELAQIIPLEQLDIPEPVKQIDFELMIKEKKRHLRQR